MTKTPRNHPAGPAAWGMAIRVLPTDREVMDWASALILNIVNAAK